MKPVWVLALDTAMQGCSAAIGDGGTAAVFETAAMARGQSEALIPMMDRVVKASGAAYADLSMIAVTIGPGAFTGLRIALAAGRALGIALGVPVAGVTTTRALARAYAPRARTPFLTVIESRRSDFYVQAFGDDGAPLGPPEALDHESISARLAQGFVMIGDGCSRLAALAGPDAAARIVEGYELPDPLEIAAEGRDGLLSGHWAEAIPLYLREADVTLPKNRGRIIGDYI